MARVFKSLFVVLLVYCVSQVQANHYGAPWYASSIPSPIDYPRECNRGSEPSTVCDPDSFLWSSEANEIDILTQTMAIDYKCQVGVLIIKEMFTPSGVSESTLTEVFARTVHDEWGIGDPESQRGILLFISVLDRRVYISTGAGVKAKLNSAAIQFIISEMRPLLRGKKYGHAVQHALNLVAKVLAGKEPHMKTADNSLAILVFILIVLAIVIGLIVAAQVEKYRRAQYQECRTKLSRLEAERARALAQNYQITSCPICLEEFPLASVEEEEEGSDAAAPPRPRAASSKTVPDSKSTKRRSATRHRTPNKPHENLYPTIGSDSEQDRLLHRRPRKSTALSQLSANLEVAAVELTADQDITLLRCGHKFHSECISHWLSGHVSCPICRDEGAAAVQPLPERGRTDSELPQATPVVVPLVVPLHERYEPEYAFRLRSLRRQYPSFVSRRQVRHWERSMTTPLTADTSFIRASPTYRRIRRNRSPSSRSRSSRSSRRYSRRSTPRNGQSFGGGRSSAGGGGGW